ncbi:hypothetical protein SAMN02745181_0736 [Rubritalea squalenifaciens DSM 18772]|uniref:Membrane protein YfhO n=1 Tax=Rubritalea squalenifaciens DSM 18772 TaxID=1123071 RepID=A0A1M6DH80_9BACT|nr:YfhO family protein [Rubritalea squalenifaciens]SHI72358.1 hypothetical protein SAMN02745181_0736 [Rubritalea squalenifaciens DSM 18772]
MTIKPNVLKGIFSSLLIIVCVVAALSPALFGDKVIAPADITKTMLPPWGSADAGEKPHNHFTSDAVTQYLPYRIHAKQSLDDDGYVGWNPYSMGGSNMAGNTMALPGSWSTHLLKYTSVTCAWNWSIAIELMIAGLGMLAFLKSRKLGWIVSVAGALFYMGNTQFVIWINHRWALGSFCWMPWVLWAASDGLALKRLWGRVWWLPLFLCLAMAGGSLQHVAFIVLACMCLWAGSLRANSLISQGKSELLGWGLVGSIALVMVAYTLVPQLMAYETNVDVGHTRGGIGYPHGILQPLYNLVGIPAQVWPWLVGDAQTLDGWKLLKMNYMNVAYFGTIPMLLAYIGLFVKKMPRQAKWLILVGVLLPLTPLVGPLYHRVQILFILGGCWMAAEMLAYCSQKPLPRFVNRGLVGVVAMIGLALIVGECLPGSLQSSIENKVVAAAISASENAQFSGDQAWFKARALEWVDRFSIGNTHTLWVYGLLVLGSVGFEMLSKFSKKLKLVGVCLILVASSAELMTFYRAYVTYSDKEDIRPRHESITFTKKIAGGDLVLQGMSELSMPQCFAGPNLLSAYDVHALDAYESIQYRSIYRVTESLEEHERLSLAGVKIAINPIDHGPFKGTEEWKVVHQAEGFEWRENPESLASILVGEGDAPADLESLSMNLQKAMPIEPVWQSMNAVSVKLPSDVAWLRWRQNWHPGWQWRQSEDAEWQPVERGVDGACWIANSGATWLQIRFTPVSTQIDIVSWGVVFVWLAVGLVIVFLKYLRTRAGHAGS